MPLVMANFLEEVQDYLAANSGLGLVVRARGNEGNFTISNLLDIDNLDRALGAGIDCTMYEEGGTLTRTGRRHHQNRVVRFIYKGDYGQEAVTRCQRLLQNLESIPSISQSPQEQVLIVWSVFSQW